MIDLDTAVVAAAAEAHAVDCYEPGYCPACAKALPARARAELLAGLVAELAAFEDLQRLLAAVTAERDALDRLRIEMGGRLVKLDADLARRESELNELRRIARREEAYRSG